MVKPVIVVFQQDLRIHDNPALTAAIQTEQPVIPLYILDDLTPKKWKMGGASRVFLHGSLESLQKSLQAIGLKLILRRGKMSSVLKEVAQESDATAIFYNRHYEPWSSDFKGMETHSFKANLLVEPWEVSPAKGGYYKVFTSFWKACLKTLDVREPLPPPKKSLSFKLPSEALDSWELLPEHPDWSHDIRSFWQPGEAGATHALTHFLTKCLQEYPTGRDVPSIECTSYLSPYLHFGIISPYTVWHALSNTTASPIAKEKYLSELFWREFSYHLLYHFPQLPEKAFQERFDHFPWSGNTQNLKKWQQGLTGYPIVDAGMRQLWDIGWMHNRVRMITASFLTKHLSIPWQKGAQWFWDTLVDADLANNSASWQWVAGSGADAAPYFRIFNPTLQGEKFDPTGSYVKTWVPELKNLPPKYIHTPWEAPPEVLSKSGITLGENYPRPIVDHKEARTKALAAFAELP